MTEDKNSDTWRQLMALRAVTQMSGEVQDLQARHIILWTRVAVQRSSGADLRWDPETRQAVITVTMDKKGREPAGLKSRLSLFLASVREILGPCAVRIVSGDKNLIDSPLDRSALDLAKKTDNTVRDLKPGGGGELAAEKTSFVVQQLREPPLSWAPRLRKNRGPSS